MDSFLRWIGTFLGWLDSLTHSYMLALFLFAIIVEVLLLPLSIKQQKNSIKQAKLRPKEMAIRNKYKGRNDQVTQKKIQEEIQALYARENFSPFSGCLPTLVQLPIIIILYSVVRQPLEYVVGMSKQSVAVITEFIKGTDFASHITGNGTIGHISAIREMGIGAFAGMEEPALSQLTAAVEKGLPNFTEFGLNLGVTPSLTAPSLLLLIPVLTFIVYFGSMKLTRKFTYQPSPTGDQAMGCSNNIMDIGMPLFSVFISFQFPAAIGVYWIFKSLIGTTKQFFLYKAIPIPRFTEEDYRQAEREYAGKTKPLKEETSLPSGERPRSLHYIDEYEDYDEAQPKQKSNVEHKGTRFDYDDAPEVDVKTEETSEKLLSVERATLKDDKKNEPTSEHKKKYEKKRKDK